MLLPLLDRFDAKGSVSSKTENKALAGAVERLCLLDLLREQQSQQLRKNEQTDKCTSRLAWRTTDDHWIGFSTQMSRQSTSRIKWRARP